VTVKIKNQALTNNVVSKCFATPTTNQNRMSNRSKVVSLSIKGDAIELLDNSYNNSP